MTARHPKTESLNKSAEGVGNLKDGKKGVVSNAARYVYGLPEDATAADLKGKKAKDVWYVGGVTDENGRVVSVKLDFLKAGKTYEAVIYADGKDASGLVNWAGADDGKYNPQSYTITTKKVTSKTTLKLKMAPCGGFAVSIREK